MEKNELWELSMAAQDMEYERIKEALTTEELSFGPDPGARTYTRVMAIISLLKSHGWKSVAWMRGTDGGCCVPSSEYWRELLLSPDGLLILYKEDEIWEDEYNSYNEEVEWVNLGWRYEFQPISPEEARTLLWDEVEGEFPPHPNSFRRRWSE